MSANGHKKKKKVKSMSENTTCNSITTDSLCKIPFVWVTQRLGNFP